MTPTSHREVDRSAAKGSGTSFDIRPLDFDVGELARRALEIHELAFPGTPGLERQLRHNSRDAPKGSVFYGAFDGDRLLGLNGFVRHSVFVSGRRAAVYQSCSTATDPDFRGRGIFTSIVRYAQSTLASEGFSIIGFPNENSTPIFVGQLGFRPVKLVQYLVPGVFIKLVCSAWLREQARDVETVRFDQDELVAWKQSPSGKPTAVHRYSDVSIWGHEYRSVRLGLSCRAFGVGGMVPGEIKSRGMELSTPSSIRRPVFYNFVTTPGSPIARAARHLAVKREASVFIDYPLEPDAAEAQFDVSAGLADFY